MMQCVNIIDPSGDVMDGVRYSFFNVFLLSSTLFEYNFKPNLMHYVDGKYSEQ